MFSPCLLLFFTSLYILETSLCILFSNPLILSFLPCFYFLLSAFFHLYPFLLSSSFSLPCPCSRSSRTFLPNLFIRLTHPLFSFPLPTIFYCLRFILFLLKQYTFILFLSLYSLSYVSCISSSTIPSSFFVSYFSFDLYPFLCLLTLFIIFPFHVSSFLSFFYYLDIKLLVSNDFIFILNLHML